jgi:hypothetical protein
VTAQDQCADAAAGFIGRQSDQALFEVTGRGVRVAWACVPGRGGDHLVGRDFAPAQLYPMHQGAAGGVGVAESLRIVVDVCGSRRLECWLTETGLQLVQPLAHQAQICRSAGLFRAPQQRQRELRLPHEYVTAVTTGNSRRG